MKKVALLGLLVASSIAPVWAGSVMSGSIDFVIEGGLAGGYFNSNNTGSNNADNFLLTDALLEFSAANPVAEDGIAFMGFGNLKGVTVIDGNGDIALGYRPSNYEDINRPNLPVTDRITILRTNLNRKLQNNTGIYYGYVELKPIDGFGLELGQLRTNIGYENAATYRNDNAFLGALWRTQPNYYAGARANVEVFANNRLYLEMNDDAVMDGASAWAVGFVGEYDITKYKLSYFDSRGGRNIYNLAGSVKLPYATIGLNVDIQSADKDYYAIYTMPTNFDQRAYGFAAYVVTDVGPVKFPLRYEYLFDGDTGLYRVDYVNDGASGNLTSTTTTKVYGTHFNSYNKGYTVTFSPTYQVSDASFLRLEMAYVSLKNRVFYTKNLGETKFSKFSFAVQGAYHF